MLEVRSVDQQHLESSLSNTAAGVRSQGGCQSQTNLLHVLEGNSPGCRAAPATRLQNGLTRHHGADVVASTPRYFHPPTGGTKIHDDFRDEL
jgi:hypothetical protein